MKYTIGMGTEDLPANTEIIRDKLTRLLPALLLDVLDEFKVAVWDYIPAQGDGNSTDAPETAFITDLRQPSQGGQTSVLHLSCRKLLREPRTVLLSVCHSVRRCSAASNVYL